jgi:hypothetical protein
MTETLDFATTVPTPPTTARRTADVGDDVRRFWGALTAEFPPADIKARADGYDYIDWLAIHRRLDELCGPWGWHKVLTVHNTSTGPKYHCRLVVTDPDGYTSFRDALAGEPEMITGSWQGKPGSFPSRDGEGFQQRDRLNEGKAGARYAFTLAFQEFGCLFLHERGAKKSSGGGGGGGGPKLSQEFECDCGDPAALRVVKKAGPNHGRTFACCAKPQGKGCKFFEWSDEEEQPDMVEY